jgi:hypothetical protein
MIWLRQIDRFFMRNDMPNLAAIVSAPTISDVTEDTNLQVLIASGVISISDANADVTAYSHLRVHAEDQSGRRFQTSYFRHHC